MAAVQELLARNGVSYSAAGENLINNLGVTLDDNTPRRVMAIWMRHPEHRANILNQGYTGIGMGIAAQQQGDGSSRVVITQVFVR